LVILGDDAYDRQCCGGSDVDRKSERQCCSAQSAATIGTAGFPLSHERRADDLRGLCVLLCQQARSLRMLARPRRPLLLQPDLRAGAAALQAPPARR
jgi:hypothetical protein